MQVIDSRRGKKERCTAQPLVTAPHIYIHMILCVSISVKHTHTHTHTRTPVWLLN